MGDYIDKLKARIKVENEYEWMKWVEKIPFIDFPKEWQIKIIPPFGGAVARFIVKHPEIKRTISVYLDCYDELGYFGEPYWEMYPRTYDDYEDVYRTEMYNVKDLIENIKDEFEKQKLK